MTKRIRPFVQSLGAAALVAGVFMFQACGGGNSAMTPTAARHGHRRDTGTGTAGTTGARRNHRRRDWRGRTGTGGTAAFGEPACLSTVVKGGACTPTDQQFCYKTCGPEKTGVKTETCTTAGTYAEMSGCSFEPSQGFLLLQDPDRGQHGVPGGRDAPGLDGLRRPALRALQQPRRRRRRQLPRLGRRAQGRLVHLPGAERGTGLRTWTCASDTAWPCPLGAGC